MRILVLNYEFPPIGGGGGRSAEQICRILARRGHEILVQTSWARGLSKIEQRDGYEIRRSFAFRRRWDRCTVPEMAAYLATNLVPALALAVRFKPEVIQAHFAVPTGLLALAVSRLIGKPYLLTVHLGDVPGGVPEQTEKLFRWLKPFISPVWRNAAGITAVSDFVRGLCLKAFPVEVETVFNGVDLSVRGGMPRGVGSPVRLVFAGRFDPQKRLPALVEALAGLKDLEWRLELLGDGSEMGRIKELAGSLGLTKRIVFHGWVSPEKVEEVMSRGDIYVLPSHTEGLPMAAISALAQGLAVVGNDIGGLREVVRDGVNGMLCPPDDPRGLEMGLRRLLVSKDDLLGMKQASWERAGLFDLEGIGDRFEQLLGELADS